MNFVRFTISLIVALVLPSLNVSAQTPDTSIVPPPATQVPAAPSVTVSVEEVSAAEYSGGPLPAGLSALTLKLEIILDQVGMSPGVIDGVNGRNVAKAIAGAEVVAGLPVDGILDADIWARLPKDTPILVDYQITPEDVAGPFLPDVPTDYAEMAKLPGLFYSGPMEMFGERFHMAVDLLRSLNPNADFTVAGTQIVVAGANEYAVTTPVATLVADKTNAQLRGYDQNGKLVVAYPATIGSDELPSPSGTHLVDAVATNAAYYYNPDINFKQGENVDKLTIPPGPNNPIGTTWIDLSEPTYGIHGTPEPSKIDKTHSHGCVRLTNWDVEELAKLVSKGVVVEFQ
jgi:lipoprotein-anchoring transpeptidase ErfK/SrfK